MNDDDDNNNKNKGGLGGLLEEDSSSQTDEKPTDEDMEIDMDDAQKEGIQIAIRNNEEQAELIR